MERDGESVKTHNAARRSPHTTEWCFNKPSERRAAAAPHSAARHIRLPSKGYDCCRSNPGGHRMTGIHFIQVTKQALCRQEVWTSEFIWRLSGESWLHFHLLMILQSSRETFSSFSFIFESFPVQIYCSILMIWSPDRQTTIHRWRLQKSLLTGC